MEQVILYGAGKKAFVSLKICKFNFEPVCFVDSDELKQGTIFENTKLEVMSPQDAKKKFPDAKWFITVVKFLTRKEIQESLISNELASIEDIVNPIASLSLRYTCLSIETVLRALKQQDLWFCYDGRCTLYEKVPGVRWGGGIDDFLKMRKDWLNQLNANPKKSPCFGCALFCEEYCDDDYKIYTVTYGTTDLSLCNFKCGYCSSGTVGDTSFCDSDNKHSFKELVETLERRNLISPIWTTLGMGSGEITVDLNRKELYELANKYYTQYFSNGSIFAPEIDVSLKANKAELVVSIDAGTEETFCKIKKVNLFNEVCDNMLKYSTEGGNENICLKYIFIPDVNDNDTDFSGFAELCGKVKPRRVIISSDCTNASLRFTDLCDEYLERLFELVDKLMTAGFNVSMEENISFSQNERYSLYRLAKEKDVCYLDKLRSILAIEDISD